MSATRAFFSSCFDTARFVISGQGPRVDVVCDGRVVEIRLADDGKRMALWANRGVEVDSFLVYGPEPAGSGSGSDALSSSSVPSSSSPEDGGATVTASGGAEIPVVAEPGRKSVTSGYVHRSAGGGDDDDDDDDDGTPSGSATLPHIRISTTGHGTGLTLVAGTILAGEWCELLL